MLLPSSAAASGWSFVWLSMTMGGVSLLTPCVFPMVPITVSYFAGRNSRHARSFLHAGVYGAGIVLTFTLLGLLLTLLFGAGGVNRFAANPWVNLAIAAMFLGFAIALIDGNLVRLPSNWVARVDRFATEREGRGVLGALLMGVTFTLTSFTCTAPFIGTLLVMATRGTWRWPLIGMLAYSTVFALPFVVLALVPSAMAKLPRSGSWMNTVKGVMGFLEIAAAMKFLSNADLVWHWGVFSRRVVLCEWIVCALLIVGYVLEVLRPRNMRALQLSGGKIAVCGVFLCVAGFLADGLRGRSLGEIESFLPPASVHANGPSQAWILNDFTHAQQEARRRQALIFIDFTGYTCTNCRWMEANMFSRADIGESLSNFVTVRLYTDGDGDLFPQQQKMQQDRFGTVALPFYALVRADGTPVATFSGLTRDSREFLAFLNEGLDQ